MLPVTHDNKYTELHILLYTLMLLAVSLLPFVTGMSGGIYLIGALALGLRFLQYAIRLLKGDDRRVALNTFKYSITYLMRSEEHTSELQSRPHLVCRLLL